MISKTFVFKSTKPKKVFILSECQKGLFMPVGDIHYGAPDFPKRHFADHIQWGVDRGAYFLGMGDYLDFTSESQRKITGGLRESAKLQLDELVRARADELLELMAPSRDRWIGLITGNHSWLFQDGTSVEQYLCRGLGKGCDFLGDMVMLRLVVDQSLSKHPEADVIVLAHHGVGGGTTIAGQLLKPEQQLKWSQADLVLMGHCHSKIVGSIDKILVTPDGKTSHRTTLIARTGAFLRAYAGHDPKPLGEPAYLSSGSYVEKKALMPSSLGGICFSVGAEQIDGSKFYRPRIHYSI